MTNLLKRKKPLMLIVPTLLTMDDYKSWTIITPCIGIMWNNWNSTNTPKKSWVSCIFLQFFIIEITIWFHPNPDLVGMYSNEKHTLLI
jgi:hypothetical protein